LEIEQLRLGDKLRTEILVDESAGAVMIPVLSIQPLVENSIKHGIANRFGMGKIRVRAFAQAEGSTSRFPMMALDLSCQNMASRLTVQAWASTTSASA